MQTWLIYKTLDDLKKEFEVCAHVVDFVEQSGKNKKNFQKNIEFTTHRIILVFKFVLLLSHRLSLL